MLTCSWQSRSTCLVFWCVCCMTGGSFHWSPYICYSLLTVIIGHFHHSCEKVLRRSTYLPMAGTLKFCIASCLICCIMLFYRSMRSSSVEVAAGWWQTSAYLSCGVWCVSDPSCTTKWSSVFILQICKTHWNKLLKSTLRNTSTEMRMEVVHRRKSICNSVWVWVSPVVSFPQASPPKPCTWPSPPIPHTHYMPHPSHSSRFYHPKNIGWAVQITKLLIMYFSPISCYLVPLRPKYSPQHPILKHPHPMIPPHCQWASFTPIQNNRKNYTSVYFNL